MNGSNKTKVLLCSPYGKAVGGISRWTGHVLNYYNINKSDRILLKQFYPDAKSAHDNTPRLAKISRGIRAYLPFLWKLNRELRNQKYSVVHFTNNAYFSLIREFFTIRVARRRKVRIIVHFRFGRIPDIYQSKNWEYRFIHNIIKTVDTVIVIDKKSYIVLQNAGYKNIVLLPNPLAPQIGSIIQKNSEIKKVENKILYAGHVVKSKGVIELIEACKQINNIQLKFVGFIKKSMKSELISVAGSGSEKWLEFSGEIDFESTIKEMMSSGVFVLPTYTEGFPNVILESMACACPIVTTDVGAIPEMLDIENGFNYGICVKPKDIEGLKEAIIKMLDDRDYALQCGINAQKRVNDLYSMEKVWNKLVDIWVE